jgi:hypothetical protein
LSKLAADFLTFCRHWAPTLGKGVWEAWLEKQAWEGGPTHHVMPDIQPFVANTGARIESRAQWNEHLKRTGCVEMSAKDLPKPSEYLNPVTRKIDAAGRKEGLKLALDKIAHYKRPKSEVRALLENVVKANRK